MAKIFFVFLKFWGQYRYLETRQSESCTQLEHILQPYLAKECYQSEKANKRVQSFKYLAEKDS